MTKEISNDYHWPKSYGDPSWFPQDRFGMFIHWGLYSLAARHEWVMKLEEIRPEEYSKYFEYFNPDLYNPKEWARVAKEAGMKYVVVTTKHHDGFSLWDSKLTDYKVTNTGEKKDLLDELVTAFRNEGLKIGFYHSLIDWYHPEFPFDGIHSQWNDKEFKENSKERDIEKYRKFLHGQVRELLTNYGDIDYLWFDFSYADRNVTGKGAATEDDKVIEGKGAIDWASEELEEMILDLQPNILLNDRLDLDRGVVTPEQYQQKSNIKKDGKQVLWEACQTLNGSWGYDRDNLDWKSPELLINMLIDTVSKGGNMLLNVGPDGRGQIEPKALDRLDKIGRWMKVNSRSIYGATESAYEAPDGCTFTQQGNRLYLHVQTWPYRTIHLKGLKGKVAYAQFLHDASEIEFKEHEQQVVGHTVPEIQLDEVVLEIPTTKPDIIVPVIEMFLRD